ncbi:MAG: hypothetical protein M1816_001615 [Peltula sp. TS41687]|nr:MAG: hypothetical protein M1816_001615 [Peltula sp. TS41687]
MSLVHMQDTGYGRDINAMSISPPIQLEEPEYKVQLVAIGGQNTRIQILHCPEPSHWGDDDEEFEEFMYNKDDEFYNQLLPCRILDKHTTGIQALQWSPCAKYLFSSGGCEEFIVWKVEVIESDQEFVKQLGVKCEATCPKQSETPDTRITSFCTSVMRKKSSLSGAEGQFLISMAYSNSFVRVSYHQHPLVNPMTLIMFQVFDYDANTQKFTLLLQGRYGSCNITKVHHMFFGNQMILCTTTSDGALTWWDLTKPLLAKGVQTYEDYLEQLELYTDGFPGELKMQSQLSVHQSSVKCTTVIPINKDMILIITGGDDGAISVNRLIMDGDGLVSGMTRFIKKGSFNIAHAGGVSALAKIPFSKQVGLPPTKPSAGPHFHLYRFASVGLEGNIFIFHLTVDPKKPEDPVSCVLLNAVLEIEVAGITSMEMLELTSVGPTLIMSGYGIGGWKLLDLADFSRYCPHHVPRELGACSCFINGIAYCDKAGEIY